MTRPVRRSRWVAYPMAFCYVALVVAAVVGVTALGAWWPEAMWVGIGVALVVLLTGCVIALAESLRG